MLREQEEKLLQFCVRQCHDFQQGDWRPQNGYSAEELAAVAVFLGGVDWFGHAKELHFLAERLIPDAVDRFPVLAKETGFSCSRFSSMLREKLAHG